jgi:hypothetical protein
MPMQSGRRCPGELERNDEHDDQGDEATHGGHSTETTASTKGSFIPSTRIEDRRFAQSAGCLRGRRTQKWLLAAEEGMPRYQGMNGRTGAITAKGA